MIQSCGMAASGFTILYMRIKIEWNAIIICSLGGFFSVIFGLSFCDNFLTGPEKKMIFVSVWFSFGIALLILNLQHKRITYDSIPDFCPWKSVALFFTGLFGGLLTAMSGSGVDICSFSMLTLVFRISEKVATPTSVILMWINTWIGFYWRELIMTDISSLAWEYFSVSAPVVVTMSPLGALVSSVLHRQVLAGLVYILETLTVIGFLATGPETVLIYSGVIIIVAGTIFFMLMSRFGQLLSDKIETTKNSVITTPSTLSDESNH